MRMIEPLPKDRSIWLSAASSALFFSILDFLERCNPRRQ
jgi:hypothetical protein